MKCKSCWDNFILGVVVETKHVINTMTLFENFLVWCQFLFCKFALQESAAPRLYLWCSFCNTVHRSESWSSSPFRHGWANRKAFGRCRNGGPFVGFWSTKACTAGTFWKLPTCGPIFRCTQCKRKPPKQNEKRMQPGSTERTSANWQPGRKSLSITPNILTVATPEEKICRAQPATLRGWWLQFFPYGSSGSRKWLARQLCQRHTRDLLTSHFYVRNQNCALFVLFFLMLWLLSTDGSPGAFLAGVRGSTLHASGAVSWS